MVAAVTADKHLQVWRALGGKVARLTALASGASAVAFSPSGDLVAAAGHGQIGLWQIPGRKHLRTVETGGSFHALSFTSGGHCLAVAGEGRTLAVWDVIAGDLLSKVGVGGALRDVSISPGGRRVAAVDIGGAVYVWQWNAAAQTALATPLAPGEMAALLEQAPGPDAGKKSPFRKLFDKLRR